MEHSSRANLTPAAVALAAIVAVSIIAGFFSYRAVEANRTALFQANRLRLELQTYMTLVLDEETAVRAYDATSGRSEIDFLQPYRAAASAYPGVLLSLLNGESDSDLRDVIRHVRRAEELHARWLAAVAQPIVAHPGAKRVDTAREELGKSLVDRIRQEVTQAEVVTDRLVADRRSAASRAVLLAFLIIVSFSVIAGAIALRMQSQFQRGQRLLQAELERSNAALQEFAYVASHDLQEPLRAVAGFTQLLRKRYADKLDATANEFIDFAVDGAVRMQQLIDDILSYSRVTTHGKPLQPTDLQESVKRALGNLKIALDERAAGVEVGPLPYVQGDAVQLAQLFQNLIGNAVKYGGSPPLVTISAAANGEVWRIRVADNGIGIAPQYHDRVFRIFQRLHTRTEYGGTGVGLAIAKGIVERHGGRIWVESNAGQGATFCFTLHAATRENRQAV